MSHTIDEQLSALLDGELPAEQEELLLRRLDDDAGLRARFARYSMIRDAVTDSELHVGALGIADRVRAELASEMAAVPRAAVAGTRGAPGAGKLGAGIFGAGLAAAAALLLAVNLNPRAGDAEDPQLAALASMTPVAAMNKPMPNLANERRRANLAPERMTRYLVTHAEYSNSASRQFIDSHVVMPAFQRASWQTAGTGR
ncbi:MAG: sigma-E factor negative regulatory protein [Gammaproteobacteria bacterium]